jgi:predicted RNA-binding Zn ribbon-like protein
MLVMAAPGDLAVLERFVNTLDLETGVDELGDAEALSRWVGGTFDEAARERLVAFREALRALLLANHGVEPDPAAVAALDGAAMLRVSFDPDGTARLVPTAGGVDGVIGSLLAIVARSQADGTWPRMKACQADDCHWAYYDSSRNRSRAWCSMAECGNRAKARSYRARQR